MTEPITLDALIEKVDAAVTADESERTEIKETLRSFASTLEGVNEQIAALTARAEKAEAAAAQANDMLQAQVVGNTLDEIHSFAAGLVSEGRLMPKAQADVELLLQVAANLEGESRSYALDTTLDGADVSPYALVKRIFEGLPAAGNFKALPKDAKALGTAGGDTSAVSRRAFATDPEAARAMHARISDIRKETGKSYKEAFAIATAELND